MTALDQNEDIICLNSLMVNEWGYSCADVADRGTSQSSIFKFCSDSNIHRYDYARLGPMKIQDVASTAVFRTGPVYGRKMLTGLLRSEGYSLISWEMISDEKKVHPFFQKIPGGDLRHSTYGEMLPLSIKKWRLEWRHICICTIEIHRKVI